MITKPVALILRLLAIPFFVAAPAYYIYAHFISDGTDCKAMTFFPILNPDCMADVVIWFVVIAIAVPGLLLIATAEKVGPR